MPSVNLICAVGLNGVIGRQGDLPWPNNPEDLKWFKSNTMNGIVVFGKNTVRDNPRLLALPGRIVHVQRREETPEFLIEKFKKEYPDKDIWISGGSVIYRLWIPYVDRFYISQIKGNYHGDTWMPEFDFSSRGNGSEE